MGGADNFFGLEITKTPPGCHVFWSLPKSIFLAFGFVSLIFYEMLRTLKFTDCSVGPTESTHVVSLSNID